MEKEINLRQLLELTEYGCVQVYKMSIYIFLLYLIAQVMLQNSPKDMWIMKVLAVTGFVWALQPSERYLRGGITNGKTRKTIVDVQKDKRHAR